MGIPENLHSLHIVYTLGLWAPDCLESGRSDSGHLVLANWTLGLWSLVPKKLKMNFTAKGAVAGLIAGFSFSKNESIFARTG